MNNNHRTSMINRQHLTAPGRIKPVIKKWAAVAINHEDKRPNNQKWKKEPTPDFQLAERLKRIRFCRKHAKAYPELNLIADCLDGCGTNNRCHSGACPECGRLFQRFCVRQWKAVIRDVIEPEGSLLKALCTIPSDLLVRQGQLSEFSIVNFLRRIRAVLDRVGIKSAVGGVDFSFNEDRENRWPPFVCPHVYLVIATDDADKLRRALKLIYPKTLRVPRPIKLSTFQNSAYRRSYIIKMVFKQRISHTKKRKGVASASRNTSNDRLRVDQRIELIKYLHEIGFASRVIFRGIKPEVVKSRVRFRRVERVR